MTSDSIKWIQNELTRIEFCDLKFVMEIFSMFDSGEVR